jgi:glycosyltransferase involved in cell wall biosynthesis
VVVCQERDVAKTAEIVPSAEVIAAPRFIERRPARLAWEQVGLPRLVRATRPDVVHSPHYTMPRLSNAPVTVTVHDATFFSHPEFHSPVKARFFRSATRTAVRHAASIVVPSVATRDEVLCHVGGSPDRFHVALHGVDRQTFHPATEEEQDRVRRSLDLGGSTYIAFLGTLAPLKNVPALIRAWIRTAGSLENPPALVLAGGPGWDGEVDVATREVPEHLRLIRAGYLPFADLAGFLTGAELVAFPSIGEGFGLPVLEAMSCGAAVVTTRQLSLPEVGGDAVAYCGTDVASIADTLGALLRDASQRSALSSLAVERAAAFTWDAAAEVHLEAFARAVRSTA